MTLDRLLVTDIDGTITHLPHQLHDRVVEALHQYHDSGWKLFFLTGRYFSYAYPLFQNFSVPFLLGSQNGSSVWSSEEKKFIYFRSLPKSFLLTLEKYFEDINLIVCIEAGAANQDMYFRQGLGNNAQELKTILDSVYFPSPESAELLIDIQECLSEEFTCEEFAVAKFFGKQEEVRKMAERFAKSPEIFSQVTMNYMRWPFDFNYAVLLLTLKDVSKGFALDQVVQSFYKKKPFIMTSGDDANDIDLLSRGDFRIVMQTAPEGMHELADFLAPPAKELGILSAWEAGEQRYKQWISS
ncbi:HAD family hydrolase [Chlamydia sp.]|uniref:HAD-IIB family hydrolase n=1 Tax=Chlamydia sp. TaxID=35827 RepID=UPI0025C13BA9|nr:HAD family hydrolase [Chlamydia sp.]MBQ8498728.1 HAD family phosphatase [Chlamydia sp.]